MTNETTIIEVKPEGLQETFVCDTLGVHEQAEDPLSSSGFGDVVSGIQVIRDGQIIQEYVR